MQLVYVIFDVHTYVTRERNPDDEWSAESTDANVSFRGVKKTEPRNTYNYESLTPPIELEYDKTYFIVWAKYSTGDSFGRYGGKYEAIDIFTDEKMAEACRHQAIHDESCKDKWGYIHSYKYTRQNGEVIKQSRPWSGYFENLDDVYIESFRLEY